MPEIVLVTGGAGFIGSHLCERLLNLGMEVVNLDNFNDFYDPLIKEHNIAPALINPGYHLYRGDIRDTQTLDTIFLNHKVSVIIHLAALAGVRNSLLNPLEYIDVDVKGTVNLLECAKKYQIKRFIFGSSSSIYGTSSVPFQEFEHQDCPISPYASSKRAGELFCYTYHHLYDIKIGCLRFFTVYGPRQRPEMAIHLFTKLIDQGLELPIFGPGYTERDYTYIEDIIDGIISALNLDYSFEIFNLGNSTTTGLLELVKIIAEELGKKAILKYLPFQPGDVPKTYADISHSQQLLGYKPKVALREGIRRFVVWYQTQAK